MTNHVDSSRLVRDAMLIVCVCDVVRDCGAFMSGSDCLVGNCLPYGTASHPRRLESNATPL